MTGAKPIALPDGNGWGSHLPALVDCVLRTAGGPVLEMGCGLWSTAVLHAICGLQKRRLVSVEADACWLDKLAAEFARDWHLFLTSYDSELIDGPCWDIVLIDHAMDRRQRDIVRLADRARFIVVHDTNCTKYGYDFTGFRYRRDWNDLSPTVAVLSNVEQP